LLSVSNKQGTCHKKEFGFFNGFMRILPACSARFCFLAVSSETKYVSFSNHATG
jgi:hypothetical protein